MSGRATYTESDKARVYVALTANEGNIKRTARETGVPENTVRRWKKEFETDPPAQEAVQTELESGDYVGQLENIRGEILVELRKKIPTMNGNQLAVAFGIVEDKLRLARGLATNRTETVHALPSAEEIALAGKLLAEGAIDAARTRQRELQEAELREQPAIPARTL